MKRAIFVIVGIGIAVAILFPVINLIVGLPQGIQLGTQAGAPKDYIEVTRILGQKCGNCHSAQGNMPFYASLPLASSIVKGDIAKGKKWFDMAAAFSKTPGQPVDEATLAKIEKAIQDGSMPPLRYLALHWDGGLTKQENETVLNWIRQQRIVNYASPDTPNNLKSAVIRPIPAPPMLDASKVALGNKLYHDTRLSKDSSISCASCHDLAKGGVDRDPVSTGVGGAKGGINSPTVYNAAFHIAQFWDGRASDLAAQAAGPPANPIEMACSWPEIVQKLSADPGFRAEFEASYPSGITQENVCDAIATFEKTLLTPNCAFDKFLNGDQRALSVEAKKGYELFAKAGCITCHSGTAMGGRSYELMGRAGDYFGDRGHPTDADLGRASVTKNDADKHKFKVPTLRNIALTAPYFHDASAKTLPEAVVAMGNYELGIRFTDTDVAQIVAFLQSLTGEYGGKKLE
jgi:cytochrome c peroxidase